MKIAIKILVLALLLSDTSASAVTLNLVDLMNAHYGVGGWTYRTGPGVGTDIGPALTDGLTQLRTAQGRGIVEIPAGSWEYTTPVSTTLLSGNYIIGEGSQASVIFFNNANGVAFFWSGDNGYTGGGMRGVGILLESGLGDTNSYAVLARGNSVYQADQMEFEDLYISATGGASYWYADLDADGSARTTPQGMRVATFKNIQLFNSRYIGAYFSNAVQFSLENIGTYTGKPGTSGNDMWITGAGTAPTNTIYLSVSRLDVGGTLHLNNCTNVALEGKAGAMVTDPSADYISGWLHTAITGSVGSNSNLTIRP